MAKISYKATRGGGYSQDAKNKRTAKKVGFNEYLKDYALPSLKKEVGSDKFYAMARSGALARAMSQAKKQGYGAHEVGTLAMNIYGDPERDAARTAFASKEAARRERWAQDGLVKKQADYMRQAEKLNRRRLAQATGLAKEGLGYAREQMAFAQRRMQNPYTMGAGVQQQIFESGMAAYNPQYQQHEAAVRANLAGQSGLTSAQRRAALSRAQTQYGDFAGETQRQIGIQAALQRVQDERNAMSMSQAAQGSYSQAQSQYMSLLGNTQYRPAQLISPSTVSGGLSTAELNDRIRKRLARR